MLAAEKTLQQERYRLVHQFGQDDGGIAYEAFDNVLKTNVLLKEIPINLRTIIRQEDQKSAFADEAKILSAIHHESLPHVHDYFSETDSNYLVIELIDGNSLEEIFQTNKRPFTFIEAASWADQILDALSYLHKNVPPIIHRAINPRNIKLTTDEKIKLLDVGYTKTADSKNNQSPAAQNSEAENLQYLPLEQIWEGLDSASRNVILSTYDERSEKVLELPPDARSDIYSLGATLYYLMTGQAPIDALTRSIDLLEGKIDPLVPVSLVNPGVPSNVSGVVMQAMEIKRENRFDSAIIMRQILRSGVTQARQREAEQTKKLAEAAAEAVKLAEAEKLEQEHKVFEQKKKEVAAEKRQLAQDRLSVEQEKLEIEAERKQQSELISQKLREAEEQRLLAEQRAAEAEKMLHQRRSTRSQADEPFELDDIEVLELADENPIPVARQTSQKSEPVEVPESRILPAIAVEVAEESAAQKIKASVPVETSAPVEISTPVEAPVHKNLRAKSEILPFEAPKEKRSFGGIIAAVVILIIVGGAAGWFFLSSKNPAASQVNTEQTSPASNPVQSVPAPSTLNVQSVSEANSSSSISSEPISAPGNSEAPVEAVSSGNKFTTAPNTPRVKKQIVPQPVQPKPVVNQKKAVTVDDIINDN